MLEVREAATYSTAPILRGTIFFIAPISEAMVLIKA
jgi:hypothetical protein